MNKIPARQRPMVSVCMASYCGEKYIGQQIQSILDQLGVFDELVVVDDGSSDSTVAIVQSFRDPRVRVFAQEANYGYVRTFERALSLARGEVLMLADQDDLWAPQRVEALCKALANADVVASNLNLLRSNLLGRPEDSGEAIAGPLGIHEWRLPRVSKRTPWRNTMGIMMGLMPYFGCAMALRKTFLDVVTPFPVWLNESHDLWIAICGNLAGRMEHVSTVTTYRRLHEGNTSSPRPRSFSVVFRSRILVMRMVVEARRRLKMQSLGRGGL